MSGEQFLSFIDKMTMIISASY